MRRWLRKYRTILALGFAERFTYRTDFLFGTLMRFLPIVTTIFLWGAIFAGSANQKIAGLTSSEMVAYYLLVNVGRAFSSMPGLAVGIATDVREGHIKKYLTQPVDLIGFLLCMRMAHKFVYYIIAVGPYALVFYLCRGFFSGWPPPLVMAAFATSLILGFLIGFLFEALVGLMAFWVLEVSSFNYVMMTLTYLLSGHMFPLDLAPGTLGLILRWLPFQYLAYFPAKVFLEGERMSPGALAAAIGEEIVCALCLFALVRLAYARGLRHYSAFGG